MQPTRKSNSHNPSRNGNKHIMASLLVLLGGVIYFGVITFLGIPKVSGDEGGSFTLAYTGIENKREVVYHAYFVDNQDQSKIISEMFMSGDYNNPDFYISGSKVAVEDFSMAYDNSYIINTDYNKIGVNENSNILGGGENKVQSTNITLIGGRGNVISGGNDNATILGGSGNTLSEVDQREVPAVIVGGVRNTIGGDSQNVIIGGSGNSTSNDSNLWILGGKDNTAKMSNTIIAGNNVNTSKENVFVFSNTQEGEFSPNSPNAFYLNTNNGLGINMQATGGGVASNGVVRVGEIRQEEDCTVNNVGLQGVWSGCLVGCTKDGLKLLDKSEECQELFEVSDIEDDIASNSGYCYTGGLDTEPHATHCSNLQPESYINVVFEAVIADSCEPIGDNQCIYTCDSGYSLAGDGKCHKDCSLNGKTIAHGGTGKWYKSGSAQCPDACDGREFKCEDGQLEYGGETIDEGENTSYRIASCETQQYICGDEYNLTGTVDAHGHYISCTGYTANDGQCNIGTIKYKLDSCDTGYTLIGDSCYENCSYTGDHDVEHGHYRFWYPSEACKSAGQNNCYDGKDLLCDRGRWYLMGSNKFEINVNEGYSTSCTLTDSICGSEFNIPAGDRKDGVQYEECTSFHYTDNQCQGETAYKDSGLCATGYHATDNPENPCAPDENGQCGKMRFECAEGNLENTGHTVKDSYIEYTWDCKGSGSGTNKSCSVTGDIIKGECGKNYNICTTTGSPGRGIDTGQTLEYYYWYCPGNDGTKTLCTMYKDFTCGTGKYLPASGTVCTSCPCGYKCGGGKYTFSGSVDQGIQKCGEGTYSASGSNSCASCSSTGYRATSNQCACEPYVNVNFIVNNNSSQDIWAQEVELFSGGWDESVYTFNNKYVKANNSITTENSSYNFIAGNEYRVRLIYGDQDCASNSSCQPSDEETFKPHIGDNTVTFNIPQLHYHNYTIYWSYGIPTDTHLEFDLKIKDLGTNTYVPLPIDSIEFSVNRNGQTSSKTLNANEQYNNDGYYGLWGMVVNGSTTNINLAFSNGAGYWESKQGNEVYRFTLVKEGERYVCTGTPPGNNTRQGSENPTSNKGWTYVQNQYATLGACQWTCSGGYVRNGDTMNCMEVKNLCVYVNREGRWNNSETFTEKISFSLGETIPENITITLPIFNGSGKYGMTSTWNRMSDSFTITNGSKTSSQGTYQSTNKCYGSNFRIGCEYTFNILFMPNIVNRTIDHNNVHYQLRLCRGDGSIGFDPQCRGTDPGNNTVKGSENPDSNTGWNFIEDTNATLGACEWKCADGYERFGYSMHCIPRQQPITGKCSAKHDDEYTGCEAGIMVGKSQSTTGWTWTCSGAFGGGNVPCSEYTAPQCGDFYYKCNPGSVENKNDTNTRYTWECRNGGQNTGCVWYKDKTENCTGLPDDASWVVGTFKQTWNGNFTPSSHSNTCVTSTTDTTECGFICNDGKICDGNTGCKDISGRLCTGKTPGANTRKGDNQTTQTNTDWHYVENTSVILGPCEWTCKDDYYVVDEENRICNPKTQIVDCGTAPTGSTWVVSGFIQTWDGTAFIPSRLTKKRVCVTGDSRTDECSYKCNGGRVCDETKGCRITYTATFKRNGATSIGGSTNDVNISCTTTGSSCTITAPGITRIDGTVIGWSTNSGAQTASVSSGGTITLSNNVTYYAITYKTSKVTFDANCASTVTPSTKTCQIWNSATNCSVTGANITPKNGYTTVGWSTNSNATIADVSVGGKITLSDDIIYYAITKKEVTHTATFSSCQAESISISSNEKSCTGTLWSCQNADEGCEVDTPSVTPPNNYTFVGWGIKNNCKGDAEIGPNQNITLTGDKTYYALISSNQKSCGGIDPTGEGVIRGSSVYPNSEPNKDRDYNTNLGSCQWTCEAGYYKKDSSSCKECPGGTTSATGAASVTGCYKQYTATFEKNGADSIGSPSLIGTGYCRSTTDCPNPTVKAPSITRNTGTVIGWNTNSSATGASIEPDNIITLTRDITYYAITYKTITGTFNKGVGVASVSPTSRTCKIWNTDTRCSIEMATATCTGGYYAPAWSTNLDNIYQNTATTATCTLCPSGTISAIGATNVTECYKQYKATFEKNGADSIGSPSLIGTGYCRSTTDCPDPTVTAPTITRAGFDCDGWSTDKDAKGASVREKDSITLTGNATYYAITYMTPQVTFDDNETNSVIDPKTKICTILNRNTKCSVTGATITPGGLYRQLGWSTNPRASTGEIAVGGDIELTGNKTYYAIIGNTQQSCSGSLPSSHVAATGDNTYMYEGSIKTWTKIESGTPGVCQYKCETHYNSGDNCSAEAICNTSTNPGECNYGSPSDYTTTEWYKGQYFRKCTYNGVTQSCSTKCANNQVYHGGSVKKCEMIDACATTKFECKQGIPSDFATGSTNYTWKCRDTSHSNVLGNCSAEAVAGKCGTATGNRTSSKPTSNLCSGGTASTVTAVRCGDEQVCWKWTCSGSSTDVCYANIPTAVFNWCSSSSVLTVKVDKDVSWNYDNVNFKGVTLFDDDDNTEKFNSTGQTISISSPDISSIDEIKAGSNIDGWRATGGYILLPGDINNNLCSNNIPNPDPPTTTSCQSPCRNRTVPNGGTETCYSNDEPICTRDENVCDEVKKTATCNNGSRSITNFSQYDYPSCEGRPLTYPLYDRYEYIRSGGTCIQNWRRGWVGTETTDISFERKKLNNGIIYYGEAYDGYYGTCKKDVFARQENSYVNRHHEGANDSICMEFLGNVNLDNSHKCSIYEGCQADNLGYYFYCDKVRNLKCTYEG